MKQMCDTCENKGKINGLSQELVCDGCIHKNSWKKDLYVRRQDPKYWKGARYDGNNYKVSDVVEIQALKDALTLADYNLCDTDMELYNALKALVEDV